MVSGRAPATGQFNTTASWLQNQMGCFENRANRNGSGNNCRSANGRRSRRYRRRVWRIHCSKAAKASVDEINRIIVSAMRDASVSKALLAAPSESSIQGGDELASYRGGGRYPAAADRRGEFGNYERARHKMKGTAPTVTATPTLTTQEAGFRQTSADAWDEESLARLIAKQHPLVRAVIRSKAREIRGRKSEKGDWIDAIDASKCKEIRCGSIRSDRKHFRRHATTSRRTRQVQGRTTSARRV